MKQIQTIEQTSKSAKLMRVLGVVLLLVGLGMSTNENPLTAVCGVLVAALGIAFMVAAGIVRWWMNE